MARPLTIEGDPLCVWMRARVTQTMRDQCDVMLEALQSVEDKAAKREKREPRVMRDPDLMRAALRYLGENEPGMVKALKRAGRGK